MPGDKAYDMHLVLWNWAVLPRNMQSMRQLFRVSHCVVVDRSEVDTFLHSRSNQSFLVQLPARLQLPAQEAMLCGTRYNVPLLNALVFYVGIQVHPNS